MYPNNGLMPARCAIFALIILATNALADSRVPLTITEAEDIALSAEPGREEFLARAEALTEQSVAAGQLPDPTLRVGLANYPISGGSFSTEGMTQAQLGIRQSFPKGDSRSLSTSRLLAMADGQNRHADARDLDVLAATRYSWLETYYWHSAEAVLEESRPFFADLITITRSMYAVGRKTQYDVLRAELELARLNDRLIEANRAYAGAQAALSQWLGRDAYRSPAMKLPAWDALPKLDELERNLDSHPLLLSAGANVMAMQASVDLAEESRKPGWALDLGYGYRDGFLPSGEPRSDFISMSVTVDLPVSRKNRQDRKLAAALSERSASVSNRERLAADLLSQLALQYSRWQEQARRLALYETEILSLSNAQAEAAMLAYQSDTGTFSDVMNAYIDDLDTRLKYIRLQVEHTQTYASLASLGGLPR